MRQNSLPLAAAAKSRPVRRGRETKKAAFEAADQEPLVRRVESPTLLGERRWPEETLHLRRPTPLVNQEQTHDRRPESSIREKNA